MKPEYPQVNKLWCYDFNTKELFVIPSNTALETPSFLFDSYSVDKLQELSKTHAVGAISFYSCEDEATLRRYLDGMLPQYFMVDYFKRWCRCTIVAEGTENIYVDVQKSWRDYETPGDVMVRVCYNGKLVRTQRSKVQPYNPLVCKV